MKNESMAVVALVGSALLLAAFAGEPVKLQNAGFEQVDASGYPLGWSKHPLWHGERAGHNGSGGIVYECASQEEAKKKSGRPGQRIELKPGKRYYISALVKTTKIVTERKTPAQGISIYIEGYDAKGKWRFGRIANPCVSGTTKDWVKVEAVTREVPDGIVRAYVQPIAQGLAVGRGVVDNIYVAEYDVPPVEGVFADVYRRESAGGPVRFSASLNIDERANRIVDHVATFTYTAADGRRATAPAKIVSPCEATAMLDTSLFAFGTNDVTCTLSLAGKELGSASAPFARLAAPTPRRVYIDSHKRTIVDGKPFFPLGMYFRQPTESNLAVYAEGPFNCIMPYVYPTRKDLDLCQARGYKVIYNLQGGFNDKDAGKKWVTDRVTEFKGHPAVLAWYTNDEHPVADIPKLTARQGWVEALDVDHPTWSVQDVFYEVRHYLPTYDVLGMDPYPVPRKPIETVISSMRQGASGTFGMKAVWQVPQAFGWGWLKRRETVGQRGPTRDEIANMTWQSIAGGANGIVYYAFHALRNAGDIEGDSQAQAWERVKSAAAEVKKYEQVLLSAESVPVTGATEAVAVRTWRHEGCVYLLAVNCTAEPQKVALAVEGVREGKVLSDFGPVPSFKDGRLELSLGPIGYVMLRLM